jgi:DNA topoisomerase-1
VEESNEQDEREETNKKTKWRTLDYKGPMFPPEFEPLPEKVTMTYEGDINASFSI